MKPAAIRRAEDVGLENMIRQVVRSRKVVGPIRRQRRGRKWHRTRKGR